MANPDPSPETRFAKGQCGNPGGRPKGRKSLSSVLRDVLDEEANLKGKQPGHGVTRRELLVRNLLDEVIRSMDPSLVRIVFERSDGRVADAPEEPGEDARAGKVLRTPGSRRRRDGDGDGGTG